MKKPQLHRRDLFQALGVGLGAGLLGRSVGFAQADSKATFPEPRFVTTNGIRLAVYEAGRGLPVVFSHGFPELAFSWRHQLSALGRAGFWAIAPDQRGYGRSDRPEAVDAYTIVELCRDLVGVLDARGIERAVFCGHDWGGAVVWMMPLLHPERVLGVIGVNTSFIPRSPVPPIQMLRQLRGENNYIVAFQEPGVADGALARDVRKTFTLFMRKGGMDAETFNKLPADAPARRFELLSLLEQSIDDLPGELLLTPAELDVFVSTYERTGFTGGINWYRNIDRNWELTKDVVYEVEQPCLYVGAANDVVLPPSSANGIERWVPDIEKHVIEDCGHWTQQEKPEELNTLLIGWLHKRFGSV